MVARALAQELADGLMTRVPLKYGRRYRIGEIERAILRDIGLKLAPGAATSPRDRTGDTRRRRDDRASA